MKVKAKFIFILVFIACIIGFLICRNQKPKVIELSEAEGNALILKMLDQTGLTRSIQLNTEYAVKLSKEAITDLPKGFWGRVSEKFKEQLTQMYFKAVEQHLSPEDVQGIIALARQIDLYKYTELENAVDKNSTRAIGEYGGKIFDYARYCIAKGKIKRPPLPNVNVYTEMLSAQSPYNGLIKDMDIKERIPAFIDGFKDLGFLFKVIPQTEQVEIINNANISVYNTVINTLQRDYTLREAIKLHENFKNKYFEKYIALNTFMMPRIKKAREEIGKSIVQPLIDSENIKTWRLNPKYVTIPDKTIKIKQ